MWLRLTVARTDGKQSEGRNRKDDRRSIVDPLASEFNDHCIASIQESLSKEEECLDNTLPQIGSN